MEDVAPLVPSSRLFIMRVGCEMNATASAVFGCDLRRVGAARPRVLGELSVGRVVDAAVKPHP